MVQKLKGGAHIPWAAWSSNKPTVPLSPPHLLEERNANKDKGRSGSITLKFPE